MKPTHAIYPVAASARLLTLLLAGCAASPAGERSILLETDSYACGAEPGLGCGVALAPVLAELDGMDGVAESRVTWDGRIFRIDLLPGADGERVAAAAAGVLEGGERRISAAEVPGGAEARWWNAAGTVDLSRHEADVLAERFGAAMAEEAELGAEEARQLTSVLREELTGVFERAHAAGGGLERLYEEVPARREAFEARLAFLSAGQRADVLAILDRELGP